MKRILCKLRRRLGSDEGSVLLLALIFILLVALVITAVLGTTGTTLAASVSGRQFVEKSYAADAGLQYGIQQVKTRLQLCTGSGDTIPVPAGLIPSDPQGFQPSVQVTCDLTSGAAPGALGFALVTHDSSAGGIDIQGPGNLSVSGPVFLNGLPSSLPLSVTNGDVLFHSSGATCPTPSQLSVTPSPPFAATCTTDSPPADPVTLPASLPPSHGKNPDLVVGDCAVYKPGSYTQLNMSYDHYYFASGVYYFDNVALDFTNQDVFGGRAAGDEDAVSTLTPCSNDAAVGVDNGTGVKFVLGGTSSITADNPKGVIELFAREGGDVSTEGTQGVSVMTVPSDETSPWDPSPTDYTAPRVVAGQPGTCGGGSTFDFISHGYIDAPNGLVQIRNNKDSTQYLQGINAGHLTVCTSAMADGFTINVRSRPITKEVTITSVAADPDGGRSVRATAQIELDNTDFSNSQLLTWRQDA